MSLELSGPEVSRPYVEAARPEHPCLLDPTHRMDALFGVVNIPNVVWIDEDGVIVRPPEPGWPTGDRDTPAGVLQSLAGTTRARTAPPRPEGAVGQQRALTGGQDRHTYADAVRDWVAKGAASEYALSPAEVVARSQPRPTTASEAAAHFELANHLWRDGRRDLAVAHFRECHRLQPDNWTYKRQAWSLVGNERVGGEFGRFAQGPAEGEEDSWPFDSDFGSDVSALGEGEYYPKTL
ncbi:thioredoxin family protein [Geodermatophilus sp. CPCC 205506]